MLQYSYMTQFNAKTFSINPLKGISSTTIAEHIKLYEGYVKHANLILSKIESLKGIAESAYELSEARRRFGFEFDGMRNHELYFGALEGAAEALSNDSKLSQKITEDFGSFDNWMNDFKTLAKTRGIGWAILYYDKTTNSLLNSWIDEQHLGHLVGLTPICAIDMWEHSFVADYQPSGKAQYIDDYLSQVNWAFVEQIFDSVSL
jgi:superoxide dismutase, Fe-Mn family